MSRTTGSQDLGQPQDLGHGHTAYGIVRGRFPRRASRRAKARPVRPLRSAGEQKALAAEERTAAVRFLVIALNIVTYWAWLRPSGLGLPLLAAAVSVVAVAYGVYDLLFHPYRRFPVMLTAAWTTVTDGVLIALWLVATGAFASPYYLLWYLSLVAVAFRYDWRAPLVAAGVYSASYLALVGLDGGLAGTGVEMTIRVGYILLCGGLGALLAHESTGAFEARFQMDAKVRDAERFLAHETELSGKAQEAKDRLAAVFASSIDGIITKDLEGVIKSWNPACETLFGYTAQEVIGRPSTMLSVPGREGEERRMLEQIRAGRPVLIPAVERVRKDGSRLWVSVSASPLRDAAGQVDGCAAITRDITAVRAAEAERAEAREATSRLAAVVDSSIDGILTKDLTGRITSWNAACQRMFGYTAEEAIGQPITMLYPKGKEMEEEAVLSSIRAGRPVRIREAKRVRKDGSTFWVSVSASPLRDATGQIVGAAAIKRDVTEERAIERERLEAKERALELARLQDINRFKTQFINTAAHELRTPLLPLRMQLSLMMTDEAEPPTPAQREAMEVMHRNLERLGALVEDLLTIARSQAGRIELELESVDLAKMLHLVEESFEAVAKSQGVDLVVEPTAAGTVMADTKRVSQVLSNLLGNAFKFTPAGGAVTLSAKGVGGFVRVSVADSGRGIARANQARLFQPFVQVHDVAMTQPGSGLGLYICKQIVELHGGTIGVESRGIGKGSTFWFTLPRPAGPRVIATPGADRAWDPSGPAPGTAAR